ncbi:hypothetical protein HW130_18690 [Streptomyces sp. PKU-EA00015]|uniref:hypothetical protein n=1 Tax=Streptomyces sp. PKU-EA00015 TaxID=2748326 RepID=UPI0015A279C0|nr:hypothetical protein [Streptomyces sp. PKU-EA00015]NWF28272.1 hypothetical protein [Streptomyces sp. PKU-EA00015]
MTEATVKKTAAKRPARTADPLAPVLTEVRNHARTIGDLPSKLVGGHLPERGADNYRRRGDDWERINKNRETEGRLGIDGLAVQVAFAAFGGRTAAEIRSGLVRLASLAVAAIGQIDREPK